MTLENETDLKRPVSTRLSPQAIESLEKLAKDWNVSQATVIESLLITFAGDGDTLLQTLVETRLLLLQAVHKMEQTAGYLPLKIIPNPTPRGRKPGFRVRAA